MCLLSRAFVIDIASLALCVCVCVSTCTTAHNAFSGLFEDGCNGGRARDSDVASAVLRGIYRVRVHRWKILLSPRGLFSPVFKLLIGFRWIDRGLSNWTFCLLRTGNLHFYCSMRGYSREKLKIVYSTYFKTFSVTYL